MNKKYLQIADLTEQIEKVNAMIALHRSTTHNNSMIKQYVFKRNELIAELQTLFTSLHLHINIVEAA